MVHEEPDSESVAKKMQDNNENNESDSQQDIYNSPEPTLRRNFRTDNEIGGNGMSESNKLYYRNQNFTNSLPPTPPLMSSQVTNRGLLRVYSVGGGSNISTNSTYAQKKAQKNGNVLLQVVLPPGLHRSATNPESIFQQSAYSNDTLMDSNSEFFRPNLHREMSFSSMHTKKLGSEHSIIQKTSTDEEKEFLFKSSISIVLSCAYSILIFVLACIIYMHDIFQDMTPLYEILTLYLIIVAGVYLIYLMISIRIYLNKKRKYVEALKAHDENENEVNFQEYPEGALHFTVPLPQNEILEKPLPHYYCFVKGRHSELMYLKIGATAFCLGHLIHSVVLLVYQLMYIADGDDFFECGSVASLIMDILYPCYSLLLLFFIFKYANIIINHNMTLARFGIMHCIGASLSFWVWTIIKETVNILRSKSYEEDYKNSTEKSYTLLSRENIHKDDGIIVLESRLSHSKCDFVVFQSIYTSLSPYVYPFSVEFSILAVGVLVMIYLNIYSCNTKQMYSGEEHNKKECHSYMEESEESNIAIHLDCHASSKGIFFGIITFIISINSVILLFVVANNESFSGTTRIINAATELALVSSMVIACIFAYRKIYKLDVNSHSMSLLDDILLFICVPAFYAYFLFSVYAFASSGNVFYSIYYSAELLQVLVQTPLIVDGLRRCSNDKELRKEKPGRELMMFLIIANVAVWINETFSYKGGSDERYDFYGTTKWVISGHIALPLKMFYRFHSSVCLVDIWKHAYEPGGGGH